MDKTNYTVLSLVALVAIVACAAIFLDARGNTFTLGDDTSSSLVTGNVVATETRAVVEQGDKLDLNDDGEVDSDDSRVLGLVIDRAQFCPQYKSCDLDESGVIDMQDLVLLNKHVVENKPVEETDSTARETRPAATQLNPEFAMGAFGAIA